MSENHELKIVEIVKLLQDELKKPYIEKDFDKVRKESRKKTYLELFIYELFQNIGEPWEIDFFNNEVDIDLESFRDQHEAFEYFSNQGFQCVLSDFVSGFNNKNYYRVKVKWD
jgi:hypothetical protein